MPKRELQIGVRLEASELERLKQVAAKLWPGMPVSNGTLIRVLALQRADEVLQRRKPKP